MTFEEVGKHSDFDDESIPYKYVGVEMSVCSRCGKKCKVYVCDSCVKKWKSGGIER